jgi:DNA-binding transcriptional LysR family regulator
MGMPMHAPSLAETTAFVAVVELNSFTKAAKQLALSPPRVSEMVRNLEERLGVRLVERTTRSVAPTAAGERLLERLRPVLDEYQSALESTNEFRGKPGGMLRVTAPPPAGDFFWIRLFRDFSRNILKFLWTCPSTRRSPTSSPSVSMPAFASASKSNAT